MSSCKEFVERFDLDISPDDLMSLLAAISVADHSRDKRWMGLVATDRTAEMEAELAALKLKVEQEKQYEAGSKEASAKRINMLRGEMKKLSIDALFVPHNDEFMIKFLPKCSERIEWLTAFGGSAAELVITGDKAAIFTDGRYIDLVPEVCDMTLFSCHHFHECSPLDWLRGELKAGGRLGVATKLHSAAWLDRAQKQLSESDILVTPLEEHPLDTIWQQRPPEPVGVLEAQPIELAGLTTKEKLKLVEPAFADIDAIVLNIPETICWLCNIRGADVATSPIVRSMAIVRRSTVDLFVDNRKLTKELTLDSAINVFAIEKLWTELQHLEGFRVLYSPGATNGRVMNTLLAAGAELIPGMDPFGVYKACKHPSEQEASQRAHIRDGVAVAKFLHWFENEAKSGELTELSAAAKMNEFRSEDSTFRGVSFTTNASVGAHGAMPHYKPTEETNLQISDGALFLLDSGGQYPEGTTDITRTIAVGEPTQEMKRCYTTVLKAHVALASLQFPSGAKAIQLDTVARSQLWRQGLDFDHGTGHGVGAFLSVHEAPPSVGSVDNGHRVLPGMIFSNEPGFYQAGVWGIRIENLVLVKDTGEKDYRGRPLLKLHSLTLAPYSRELIDMALLSEEEIEWIDEYHKRVYSTLSERVDETLKGWLKKATARLRDIPQV